MSGMTFATLNTQIQNYVDRNDAATIAEIPFFINLAEQRLSRELEDLGEVTVVVGNMIAGTAVYPKPGRWRRTLAMNYGTSTNNNTRVTLLNRDYDTLRQYWPNDTLTSPPLYYADYGHDNWLIAPTPDLNYPYEVSYLQLPEQLSSSNQTNYFTNYLQDLLFFASMLETSTYLKLDERVPMWQSYYERALHSAKAQNHSRLLTRTSNIQSDKGPPK